MSDTTETDAGVDPTPEAPRRRLVPPTSSFDFTNGAFERSRNTRVLNTVLAGVALAAVLVLTGAGLQSSLGAGSSEREVEAAQVALADAAGQLKAAVAERLGAEPPGSLTTGSMRGRINTFSKALRDVAGSDIDAGRLIDSAAAASASAGATLTGVDVLAPGGSLQPSTPTTVVAGAAPPPADDDNADATVVLTATSTGNAAALESWKTAIQGLGWVKLGEDAFEFSAGSGGQPNTFTARGTLDRNAARSAAGNELIQRFPGTDPAPAQRPDRPDVPNRPFGPSPDVAPESEEGQ